MFVNKRLALSALLLHLELNKTCFHYTWKAFSTSIAALGFRAITLLQLISERVNIWLVAFLDERKILCRVECFQ